MTSPNTNNDNQEELPLPTLSNEEKCSSNHIDKTGETPWTITKKRKQQVVIDESAKQKKKRRIEKQVDSYGKQIMEKVGDWLAIYEDDPQAIRYLRDIIQGGTNAYMEELCSSPLTSISSSSSDDDDEDDESEKEEKKDK